jgi:hypothetical protein
MSGKIGHSLYGGQPLFRHGAPIGQCRLRFGWQRSDFGQRGRQIAHGNSRLGARQDRIGIGALSRFK